MLVAVKEVFVVCFLLIGLIHCDLKLTLSRRFPVTEDSASKVWLTLENPSSVPIALLRHHTPFDFRFGGNAFVVNLAGKSVDYIGPVVHYAKPSVEDYVVILPGSTLEFPVDLKDSYDLTQVGPYDISLEGTVLDYVQGEKSVAVLPSTTWNPVRIFSNNLTFYLGTPHHQEKNNFGSVYPCTTNEITIQKSAQTAEKALISKALQQINKGSTAQYIKWFGAFLGPRFDSVRKKFINISSNTRIAFKCDNNSSGILAYVYANDTAHNIYCCKAFWNAPSTGFDSKPGTILHELSHFNDIGGTIDIVYGNTNAQKLAKTDPDKAIMNADNYEYFSEDPQTF